MYRKPFSTLLAAMAIGIALSIPMLLYVVVDNFSETVSSWRQGPGLSVYLRRDLSDQAGLQLAEQLESEEAIEQAIYIDKALGLDLFLSSANLGEIADLIDQNPLPGVIDIGFRESIDSKIVDQLADKIENLESVDVVQIDLDWVLRLRAALELLIRAIWVLWILLFSGVALVIANTIRMAVMSSRDEIEVISLVGGNDRFIRRPFLYMGALHGILGAVIACLVLLVVTTVLGASIQALFEHYGVEYGWNLLPGRMVLFVTLLSAALGWCAAWISVTRYLRTTVT